MTVTVSIGDVAKIQSSSIDPRKYPDTLFQLYSIPGFDNDKTPEQLLGSNIGSNKSILPQRGVLFSKLNPRINRVWVIGSSDSAKRIASTEFVCLVPEEKHLDLEFLAWRLRVPGVANQLPVAAAAATKSRQRIQPKLLLTLPIPLPPLDEQRRIVGILNRAATIERLRTQAAERLREFVPALFIKMFGDPVENPMGWEVRPLAALISEFRYGTSRKCYDSTGGDDGVPVLRIPNILRGHVDWTDLKFTSLPDDQLNKLHLERGDILFVRTNGNPEYIGRCAIFRDRRQAAYASYLIRARLKPDGMAEPEYISNGLALPTMRQTLLRMTRTTAGNYNISIDSLGRIRIPVPELKLQQRFSAIIVRTRETLKTTETSAQTSLDLSASLMNQLLDEVA